MAKLSIEPNERVTFKVMHLDEGVVVVSKAAGLVTAPGLGHEADSLLNGLFARWGPALQNLGRSRDFGLLHRLDKETSGLVVAALTTRAYDGLREAFEKREVKKFYWAVVAGRPRSNAGVIRRPLVEMMGKVPDDTRPKKLSKVSGAGKPAVTAYRVLEASPHGTLLECRAVTGRLHQVRVHLASIRCPILGDGFYGTRGAAEAAPRLALHAHRVAFVHPLTGATVDVRSGWPPDLRGLLRRLGLKRPEVGAASGTQRSDEIEDDPVRNEDT